MAIDKTNITNCIQSTIDNANDTCETTDIFLMANSVDDNTTDRKDFVETDTDLPDLFSSNIPEGTIFYVKNLGVPVVASDNCWLGLDGRLFRFDQPKGEIYGWGNNIDGQIGDGTDICRSSPVQEVSSSTDWCQVSVGDDNSLALKTSGTVWAWGYNFRGAIGDGTVICRSSPVQEVTSSSDWCQVSGRSCHSLAIKTSGTLWAWGYNFRGIIGDGTDICRSSPVQEVSSSTDWCQISGGRLHSLALKTSGTLWAWGYNFYGAIGDGTTICRSSPVQEISSSSDWCQISGGDHSLALKTSGTLWAWGYNFNGQIGDGTTICRSSPVQEVTSSTDWCQVSGARFHSLALKTSGTLWAWGRNFGGGLGDGTLIDRSSPVQEVSSSTDWCQISSGRLNSLALKTSGTLWGWGSNSFANLGDGATIDRSSPVQEVSASTDWCQVSGGGCHSLAIKKV